MRLSLLSIALLSSGLLFGCGGSSSSSPAQPTPDPTPQPVPQTLSFTIDGIATDAPIANATITAFVGEASYNATAAADGTYSLTFEYQEGELTGDEMITLNAQGEGEQAHVELASQLGSFAALQQAAGDDAVIEQSESHRTAITQISTALHLLAEQTGIELKSDENLEAAEALVNAEQLMDVSAIIKVLADNPSYTPQQGTLMDILTAGENVIESVDSYLAEQGLVDAQGEFTEEFAEAFEQALEQTISDPAVTLSFDLEQIPGRHLATATITQGWVPNSALVYSFNANGSMTTGNYNNTLPISDLKGDWELNDTGEIEISYADEGHIVYEYIGIEGIEATWGEAVANHLKSNDWLDTQIAVLYKHTSDKITKLSAQQVALTRVEQRILTAEAIGFDWQGGDLIDQNSNRITNLWHDSGSLLPTWESAPTGTWALPTVTSLFNFWTESEQDSIVSSQVTLGAEGSLLDSQGQSAGAWSFADGSLTLSGNNGWTSTITPFAQQHGLFSAIIQHQKGDITSSSVRWLAQFDQQSVTLVDDLHQQQPNMLAAWINGWIATAENNEISDFENIYGYNISQDGTMKRIFAYDNFHYNDQTDSYQRVFIEDRGLSNWVEIEDHHYQLSATADWGDRLRHRQRDWIAVATLANGNHLVLEQEAWEYDYFDDSIEDISGVGIASRINVLAPFDLSVYAETYQRSVENGYLSGTPETVPAPVQQTADLGRNR